MDAALFERARLVDGYQAVRVLFLNPLGGLGGAERSLLDLLVSLRASGLPVEPRLLLMADGELARRVRELGIPVDLMPMPAPLASLGEFRRDRGPRARRALHLAESARVTVPYLLALRGAIRRARPDVVHTNGMKAHLSARLAVPELPTIVHVRDFASQRPLTRHLLLVHRRRAIFAANSRAVEADLLGLEPRAVTRVIYNAIDVDAFAPGPADPRELASLAGLPPPPPGSIVIGMVATYAWWKGHRTFVAAAARMRELSRVPLRFYVVGGPIYGAPGAQIAPGELEELIRGAGLTGSLGLVPFQAEMAQAYRGMDVVVQPSERPEPFGRVIVEAMASGKPVVVARAGGAVELFEEGETGFGFVPGDPSDCARALRPLVEDAALRERVGKNARNAARTRFNRERLAADAFELYRDLLALGK